MIDDATRVKEQKPLLVMILGFSKDKVHVILARHVANYRWHWQHSVEADLKIQRSPEVDERLNLAKFTKPFTRTIDSVNYGDVKDYVHQKLGLPDAEHYTSAGGLFWDYYFDRNITIEYQFHVFKITDGVPEHIRHPVSDDPMGNPLVEYRDKE